MTLRLSPLAAASGSPAPTSVARVLRLTLGSGLLGLLPGVKRSLAVGALALGATTAAHAQTGGSILGVVRDGQLDINVAGAKVQILETGDVAETGPQGEFRFSGVPPGVYTLIVSKPGYVRGLERRVAVQSGGLQERTIELRGDFVELDEHVVQDVLALGGGTEAELLARRFESPALMDSISSELMSRSGASSAEDALKNVTGASIGDDATAVIRGLPDRYVSSQVNGVRMPSANEDKRAVELDQFPSAVMESLQVSKTFTPDQQGDASGGAVDVRLKGLPSENTFSVKVQGGHLTNATGRGDFLTYPGGGLSFLGDDGGDRDLQFDNIGGNWDGAVGASERGAPTDYKWSIAGGGSTVLESGWRVGGFTSLFYERDSSFTDDAVDDSWWVTTPGQGLVPETSQGAPDPPGQPQQGDFKTKLFDITRAKQSVQWGNLTTLGLESDRHFFGLTFLYTHSAEDTATLAVDTRGKEYFFPGYDPNDPMAPGNTSASNGAAPYIRNETLEYTERTTGSLQLTGRHTLAYEGGSLFGLDFGEPKIEWTLSQSFANLNQPDKRQFGAIWRAESFDPGNPTFGVPPSIDPASWTALAPSANINLGNLQRIFKTIDEDSTQLTASLNWPFDYEGRSGSLETGFFTDQVEREFRQESFSNFNDPNSGYQAPFNEPWSAVWEQQNHTITGTETDVDYDGEIDVSAFYGMIDMPVTERLTFVTGARFESTDISITNDPEPGAFWFPPGATAETQLNPGEADVAISEDDILPAIGLEFEALEGMTVRAAYSQTIARQTFKEITPIIQQEFAGGPIFIGNPNLELSALDNFDLRMDFEPYDGGIVSMSWFYKDVDGPIEYVQRLASTLNFTEPVNYPEGRIKGVEVEVRHKLGEFVDALDGLSVGANATFIDSRVELPDDERADFANLGVPITSRDMTNAPESLYNLFLTYDLRESGTKFGLFYTIQGDTLVAGAGEANGNFVPSVYQRRTDTLNLTVSQSLGPIFKLEFKAKNLTDPLIEEVFRSPVTDDKTNTSFHKGIDYSLAIGAKFSF